MNVLKYSIQNSLHHNPWLGADYGDPQNYLGQEMYGYDNAFYVQDYNYVKDVEETEATKICLIPTKSLQDW